MSILEFAHQAGLNPKWVASTGGGEYHSACPICSGKDRFFIQPLKQMSKCLGSYCCRKCGIFGDSIQFAREFLNYSYQEAAQALGTTISESFTLPTWVMPSTPMFSKLQMPPDAWIENATKFVSEAHENLLSNDDALQYLASRGLPLNAVQQYKLGWSYNNYFLDRTEWGLKAEQKEDSTLRKLWMPKGLVIPTIELNKVVRLKIRRSDYKPKDKNQKYIAISGSMNGLSLIGKSWQNIIVVESELDAYAIDFVAHDLVSTIAVGSNIKNPDNITDSKVKKAKQLLICHDNDEAGLKMLEKWQKLYAHAKAYPTLIGKDIGDAIQQGVDIKEWLSQKITYV